MIIGIDPGHGGNDCGAVSNNIYSAGFKKKKYYERDLVLELSLKIRDILEKNNIQVVMTRIDNQSRPNIQARANRMNYSNCNLDISIHLNSAGNPNVATGSEIWVHSKANKDTLEKAQCVQDELVALGFADRKVKKGYITSPDVNFGINRLTNAASMLVEVCFIDNDKDIKFLINNMDNVAMAISKGIGKAVGLDISKDTKTTELKSLMVTNLTDKQLQSCKQYLIKNNISYQEI